jgi:hypothetical protein
VGEVGGELGFGAGGDAGAVPAFGAGAVDDEDGAGAGVGVDGAGAGVAAGGTGCAKAFAVKAASAVPSAAASARGAANLDAPTGLEGRERWIIEGAEGDRFVERRAGVARGRRTFRTRCGKLSTTH